MEHTANRGGGGEELGVCRKLVRWLYRKLYMVDILVGQDLFPVIVYRIEVEKFGKIRSSWLWYVYWWGNGHFLIDEF